MANFAAISYDMQTLDDDFRTLSPDHRHVWLALLATRWPKCGIFKGGISPLANATGRDRDVILEALATFERLGWIFREGEYIWIRSWIRHRSQNANWLTGALKEARELVPFTPLAQRCLDEYAVDTPSRRRVDAVLQYSTVQNITEQQSTASGEFLSRNGKPSRAKPRQRAEEPAEYVQLATEIEWYIRERIQKYNIAHGRLANEPQECARVLRLLVEADGYPVDGILPALAWSWTQEFKGNSGRLLRYGAQLLSMAQWRGGTPHKFDKLWKSWHDNTPGYNAASKEMGAKLRGQIQARLQETTHATQ